MTHHPSDTLLMECAAARISAGLAAVIDAHVEGCADCTARRHDYETVGGVLLEQLEPSPLPDGLLSQALARVVALGGESGAVGSATTQLSGLRAVLPSGTVWPRSLYRCKATPWRRVGPGLRWSGVTLAHDASATVYLMRVAPGKSLPAHSHGGLEMTYVLYGAFTAGGDRFEVGDLEVATDQRHHQPVAGVDGECICLTAVEGHVAFDGPLAKVMGRLLGL